MATLSVDTPYGGGSAWDVLGSLGESYMDYLFGSAAADDALERQEHSAKLNAMLSKDLANFEYGLNIKALQEAPSAAREGLIAAGYNPLLAVNSGAGAAFSNSIPGAGGTGAMAALHGSNSKASASLGSLLGKQMEKVEAETNFIRRRTEGEGWQVKTLTRSEAMGLGANLVQTLGFNFHDSSQQTFLVAYNPITGELRNLGDTSHGLGTTGETTNAGQVDVEFDGRPHSSHHYKGSSSTPYFSEFLNDTPRSPLR